MELDKIEVEILLAGISQLQIYGKDAPKVANLISKLQAIKPAGEIEDPSKKTPSKK